MKFIKPIFRQREPIRPAADTFAGHGSHPCYYSAMCRYRYADAGLLPELESVTVRDSLRKARRERKNSTNQEMRLCHEG